MSHDSLWYNGEQLAGPSSNSIPLSFDSPKLPYKIGLPPLRQSLSHVKPNESFISQTLQERPRSHIDTEAPGQYDILPQFQYHVCEEETTKRMVHFHNRFRSEAHGGYHPSSTFLAGSPNSSSADDSDEVLSGMPTLHPTIQHSHSHAIFRYNSRSVQSPLYPLQDVPPFFSCQYSTPLGVAEFPGSPCLATPKPKEMEDLQLDSDIHGCPRTLSPYAPMPLQPIFHLEPQSKTMQDPIDPVPGSLPSPRRTDDAISLPIDPLLTSLPLTAHEEGPHVADVPFARGSITSGCLWPPPSFVSGLPMLVHQSLCLPTATDIPLDIAKQYARDCRAASPYTQLSQQFLLSFMGQFNGQLPWSCYIQGCGKQLTRKSHMIDHIRMHLDERVYACEYCPQTFLRKADCKRHSAAHNPEKAFQCDLCVKSFGRKDLLTRHKRKCETNFNQNVVCGARVSVRKRKGPQVPCSILNTQGTQDGVISVAGGLFPDHSENNKSDKGGLFLKSDGSNKENIPPFLLPLASNFMFTPTTTESRPRKRARVLL